MYELPITVTIDDRTYKVREKADYRIILGVIATLEDVELTTEEQVITALIIFYEQLDTIESVFETFNTSELLEQAIDEMMRFIGCYDDNIGYQTHHKVIDWVQDELMIISAINKVANTEVRALKYLHWWTFISYYMAIGESTLATVVGIRDKLARHKKLDDFEKEFKRDNPQYFKWKADEKKSQQLLEELWNKE